MSDLVAQFQNQVALKFQLYNSLFLTLPIDEINNTGILLPLLSDYCQKGLENGKNPQEIMKRFFADHEQFSTPKQQFDFLFRVIQYVERQIVLVDALEDAAYDRINDVSGHGSLKSLFVELDQKQQSELEAVLSEFAVRIVLTAHPTQFYPGSVLAIITDLTEAIAKNNLEEIRMLLQQLGKTPFFRKQKPTPYDEAVNLSWYLENVFYRAAGNLYQKILQTTALQPDKINHSLLQFGFWPGGDRDGNPFVTTETTLEVAERLRHIAIRCYYNDIRALRRRLSFKGVYEQLTDLQDVITNQLYHAEKEHFSESQLQAALAKIASALGENHNGLFVEKIEALQNRVSLFGLHFASIDVRQDSRIIAATLASLLAANPNALPMGWDNAAENEQVDFLFRVTDNLPANDLHDAVQQDTFQSFKVIKQIQARNGERGAHRYIISNCRGAVDVARVFALARFSGWHDALTLDIIPLFETIEDLEQAGESMRKIYEHPIYRAHLQTRGNCQTVMLGFSDGTKDGGYFSANWNIYRAKERITAMSRNFNISVVFFDGRGGPPARGGGNTQKFYTSLGPEIENRQIQLTVQGQTISSLYGTEVSAIHNMESLLVAGLKNNLMKNPEVTLGETQRALLQELADTSQAAYQALKDHPDFMPYLLKMSTLKYYGQANIGSRPSKRGQGSEITFSQLRAIPFVGAWSQLKQNVPGFFGVGTALKSVADQGRIDDLKALYQQSAFFRALCENSMQSLSKTYFPITQYMRSDPEFGAFWQLIYEEYKLSCDMLLQVSGQSVLLQTNPTSRQSIALREQIVLPLICIQQYALMALREAGESEHADKTVLEKLVIRAMYGNINASRNSA